MILLTSVGLLYIIISYFLVIYFSLMLWWGNAIKDWTDLLIIIFFNIISPATFIVCGVLGLYEELRQSVADNHYEWLP